MSFTEEFIGRISAARKSSGMTMEDLAERAGIDRTYVGLLERGGRSPSLEIAVRMTEAVGLSVGSLFTELDLVVLQNEQPSAAIVGNEGPGLRGCITESFLPSPRMTAATTITPEEVGSAIAHAYMTLDVIDAQLLREGVGPLAGLVELANLSSILGNLLGTGLSQVLKGRFERNGPHKFPDLVPLLSDLPGVEIKTALENNRPKGHLPKEGHYLTFRYVLVDDEGVYTRGRENRGQHIHIWDVRYGELFVTDFSVSNTEGDSGKTAVFSTAAFDKMEIIYLDRNTMPITRIPVQLR